MLTLWQDKGKNFDAKINDILIVKTGKVIDFRGNKKISVGQNSHLKVNDTTVNEVKR